MTAKNTTAMSAWLARRRVAKVAPFDASLLLAAALGALAAALVLMRQATFGPTLSYDSISYITMARNLLDGAGLKDFTGISAMTWPPMYPFALAFAGLGFVDPLHVAGPLNAAVFGLTVFMVCRYLQQRLASGFLAAWACLAIALAIPLAYSATCALSETLFIFFTTAALIWLDRCLLARGKIAFLIIAAALAACAWLTRNVGVAMAAFGTLALLLQRNASLRRNLGRSALFGLIATAPTAAWLLRNYLQLGTLTAHRSGFEPTVAELLNQTPQIFRDWSSFELFGAAWPLAPWLIIAPTLLALVGYPALARRARSRPSSPVALFSGFALTYFVALIAMLMPGFIAQGVEPRYLLPIYIPIVIGAAAALDRFFALERERPLIGRLRDLPAAGAIARRLNWQTSNAACAMMLAFSLWLAGQAVPNLKHVERAQAGDMWFGYNGQRWRDSETLRYLREHPLSGRVLALEPNIVHFHNRSDASYEYWPSNSVGYFTYKSEPASPSDLNYFRNWLAAAPRDTYLIWLTSGWRFAHMDYGPEALRVLPGLAPVADLADGAIFQVDPEYVPTPSSNRFLAARALIRSGEAGAPAASSIFEVYLLGNALAYYKEPCIGEDVQAAFFLYVYPASPADLPVHRREEGFDKLDFNFERLGAMFEGTCLALAPLPEHEIDRVKTGQWRSPFWQASFAPSPTRSQTTATARSKPTDEARCAALPKADAFARASCVEATQGVDVS